jgi:hypothetical protein
MPPPSPSWRTRFARSFETSIRTRAEHRPNLGAYRDRLMKQYFADPAAAEVAA